MGKYDDADMAHEYIPELDAFELYHKEEEPATGPALPALGHALSGATGAAISNAITYPLQLIITRLQVQRQLRAQSKNEGAEDEYKDILDAVQKIYQNEGGLKAFYAGLGPELGKTVADSFLFFLAYSFLRNTRQQSNGGKKTAIGEELGLGMVAGAFAKLFTTPVQNIVTRKQTASMVAKARGSSVNPELSTKDIYLQIRHQKGLQGLWAGYSAALVLTLNPGLTFLLHELFQRMLTRATGNAKPGPKTTFAVAASSKAIASSITYPLSVAKSRAQVSSKAPIDAHAGGHVSRDDGAVAVEDKIKTKLERNTVLGQVLRIARQEGAAELYAGLAGEVLKGFFQHGLTMVMKERVYFVIVQLYYALLKALRRYPGPEELAALARQRAEGAAERGASLVKEAASSVTRPSAKAAVPAGDVYGRGQGKADFFPSRSNDKSSVPAGDVYGKGEGKS